MDLKVIFVWLSLILLFFAYNPFFPYGKEISWYITITNITATSYISVFLIYLFVKYYEKIKQYFSDSIYKTTSFLVHKSIDPKKDLLKFSIISILLIFFIDVTLTKISEQSFFNYSLGFLGFDEVLNLMSLKDNLDISQNQTGINQFTKFQNIQSLTIFFGPLLGPVILFFLRQLSYKKHSKHKMENPGGRILLLFIIIAAIIVILDLSNDINKNGINFDQSLFYYTLLGNQTANILENQIHTVNPNTKYKQDNDIIQYTFTHLIIFILKNLIYGWFYISLISIWILDRYIFSKLWENSM